jgi:1,4-dihydroxy-2-naphthoate octaprenyltransferase
LTHPATPAAEGHPTSGGVERPGICSGGLGCLNRCIMATPAHWLQGARPRTLPAAVAPVVAGTGVAAYDDATVWWKALLALVVSLALQVAVNYANDYSDGIRGTDDERVGPLRLVGSGLASPAAVRRAAFLAFAVAGVAGLVLAATTSWWLVVVGLLCVLAAWYYTGGSRPYGYLGLGEVMVFVFFGLVAVVGTTYVQTEEWGDSGWTALVAGAGVGALACAILVANNLRDIPTDTAASKITLAVRLGDRRTRAFYAALVLLSAGALVGVAVLATPWALLGLPFLAFAAPACRTVLGGAIGPGLIPVLQQTGLAELVWAVGCGIGLAAG